MKWSLKLGSIGGIGVYLHWTFALLIGWIFLSHLGAGQTTSQALVGVGFVLALFTCVVMHEFGHALVAKHYGVRTRDITLLPIGGVARMERIPDKPLQEFWVSVAGPAVNALIAGILFVILMLFDHWQPIRTLQGLEGGFIEQLMWVNLFIGAFNLLPAFPMDGGRVLRSLLATRMGHRRATVIAANIGQVMAILLGVIGFFYNPILIFIAVFVYLGAQGEVDYVETQSSLEGLHVRDAMMTRFRSLSAGDSVDTAVEELLAGAQQDFPVLDNGQILGILRRNDLVKALTDGLKEATVGDVMCRECFPVEESDVLMATLETMSNDQNTSVPVLGRGRFVGLLTLENIGELLMVNAAITSAAPAR